MGLFASGVRPPTRGSKLPADSIRMRYLRSVRRDHAVCSPAGAANELGRVLDNVVIDRADPGLRYLQRPCLAAAQTGVQHITAVSNGEGPDQRYSTGWKPAHARRCRRRRAGRLRASRGTSVCTRRGPCRMSLSSGRQRQRTYRLCWITTSSTSKKRS